MPPDPTPLCSVQVKRPRQEHHLGAAEPPEGRQAWERQSHSRWPATRGPLMASPLVPSPTPELDSRPGEWPLRSVPLMDLGLLQGHLPLVSPLSRQRVTGGEQRGSPMAGSEGDSAERAQLKMGNSPWVSGHCLTLKPRGVSESQAGGLGAEAGPGGIRTGTGPPSPEKRLTEMASVPAEAPWGMGWPCGLVGYRRKVGPALNPPGSQECWETEAEVAPHPRVDAHQGGWRRGDASSGKALSSLSWNCCVGVGSPLRSELWLSGGAWSGAVRAQGGAPGLGNSRGPSPSQAEGEERRCCWNWQEGP